MAKTAAILVARLIFGGVFLMGATFKLADIGMTASQVAAIGFPAPTLFAWLAALFEVGLAITFISGAFFREAALLAIPYILFLNFAYHGPSTWAANPMEFGFFVDHFVFSAGLLFAAAHGPGERLAIRVGLLRP